MGLWGSKQQKDVSIANPEPIGQVFVTDDALKNVIKTVEEQKSPPKNTNDTNKQVTNRSLFDCSFLKHL